MSTVNHSSSDDVIVPTNNGTTYRGLGGNDTYIISKALKSNAAITIVDTSGKNIIQLIDGTSIASSKFAADAVQLILSNGAVITVNGSNNFSFELGGNATTGISKVKLSFLEFSSKMGVATLPASGSIGGASNVSVSGAALSSDSSESYNVSSSGTKVTEGNGIIFTITANTSVSADTTFSWTVVGDTNSGTVDKASATDIDAPSGKVTIVAGSSSATFSVTAIADSIAEGIEGIRVSVFDANSVALSSDIILVDNGGSSATPTSVSNSNNSVTKNASDNIIPSSGTSTDIKVTEDVIGGVLLDLTSLKIEKGSITVKSFGPISRINDLKLFDNYFLLDETILKLKDDVNFNTDLSELINLKELTYFTNQTDEIFKISFSYRSEGVGYTHTVNIIEFIDTPYGSGLYGDSAYIFTEEASNNDVNSLIGSTKFVNTESNTSEIIEIFYSFPSADSEFIESDVTDVGSDLDSYYQSSDSRDILYDATDSFKSAVKDILDDTASIFKLKFTELTGENADKASIRFILWDSEASIPAGYSTGPQDKASFVFISKPNNNDYSPGTYVYGTIRHELGHALGLEHPFEGENIISSEFNTELYTIMAYSSVYDSINNNPYDIDGFTLTDTLNNEVMSSKTWQMYDIAALKHLYGIREIYNSSDNTYSFKNEASFSLIHDLGGYDTIDLSGSSANNDIENRQIDLGGGAFYQAGNKTIIWEDDYQTGAVYTTSFDTEIEKFIGSNGIDNVTLGPTSDTVFTNGGDDQIWNIGTYKLLSSTKVNAGSGDDSVFVTVYDNSELNSLIDIDGGSGYDRLFIFGEIEEVDLSLYMNYFDNFEYYIFIDDNPQTIIVDGEDFIDTSYGYLTIGGGPEDTLILPEGTVQDTNEDDDSFDYYEFEGIQIAVNVNLTDNLMIG